MGLRRVQAFGVSRLALTWFVVALSGLAPANCVWAAAPPPAVGGLLDLRGWDFSRDGEPRLTGQWLFYPGVLLAPGEAGKAEGARLRSVPDFWKGGDAGGADGRGAGTYILRLLLPEPAGNRALRIRTLSTAFRLFANGEEIAHAGNPAVDAKDAIAAYAPGIAILPPSREILLTVWVSNHEYRTGGMWRAFVLGPAQRLIQAKRREDVLSFGFSGFLACVALGSLSFYFLRRKDRGALYLCLFALIVGLRILVTGDYGLTQIAPGIGFDSLIRLEYSTVFLAVPLGALLFLNLYAPAVRTLGRTLLTLPSAAFLALVPVAPLPVLTRSILFYYPVALATIASLLVFVLVPAALRRGQGVAAMIAGSLFLVLAAINDMLYSSFLVHTGNLLPLGLTLFVASQAFVVAQRFLLAFSRVETLSASLAEANAGLEREMALSLETRRQLEATLAEKEILLREVHHRVKNSLQIVSSIIALQAHRAREPAAIDAYSKVRVRLRAISMVHEKLYSLASGERLDLGEYARDLVGQLAASHGTEGEGVRVSVEVEGIDAPVDICIDAGLILTELVSNAYQHSVIPRGEGTIRAILRRSGDATLELWVEDDGPGFPRGFLPDKATSLGFKIITTLLRKRGGRYIFEAGPPARVGVSMLLS